MYVQHILISILFVGASLQGAASSPLLMHEAALRCSSVEEVELAGVTVTSAAMLGPGEFEAPTQFDRKPPSTEQLQAYKSLPAFCRVVASVKTSERSAIEIEVWMPAEGWNRKLQAVGNGAFMGWINYFPMAEALRRGYATTSTDTGHTGNNAQFALENDEKIRDFAYRAVHVMALTAKAIVAAHYDDRPDYSYWNGCSAGGRQAMMAAQRYPEDFDGIVAGAPGMDWSGRAISANRMAEHLLGNPLARLTDTDRAMLHDAVVGQCDSNDGVVDGLISDPERCLFEPDVLQCSQVSGAQCLSKAQIDTIHMMYSSPENPATGLALPGLAPGSEEAWTDLGWTRSARATGLEHFRYLVHKDPEWLTTQFKFETDVVAAKKSSGATLDALDTNLVPFFQNGGKLIHYHGWSDSQISPVSSTQYFWRLVDDIASNVDIQDSYRLFMAPGMGHCTGGDGPDHFDMMLPLERWVEQGEAPLRVVATKRRDGQIVQSRPLCPYPEIASFKGSGDSDSAENYVCAAAKSGGRTSTATPRRNKQ